MKTPKEKAKELVQRFEDELMTTTDEAKQCALICVQELMIECEFIRESYWYEVKQEIDKL